VPLVISGHFHETTATVRNGTLYLRIGTTGGSGAGIFRDLADIPFSAEVLYFSREPDPELIAYDVIEQLPESGSLTGPTHHGLGGVRRPGAHADADAHPDDRCGAVRRVSFRLALIPTRR
jgi:hypothetical protein